MPEPNFESMGAPTKSYSRKSSTMRGELAHRMLSVWKKRMCLAGARRWYSHGWVKKRLMAGWLVRVTLDGSCSRLM